MTTNKLNENDSGSISEQLENGCTRCRPWEISGGEYKGCGVGGWMNADGDTTHSSDCSDSRFQPPC